MPIYRRADPGKFERQLRSAAVTALQPVRVAHRIYLAWTGDVSAQSPSLVVCRKNDRWIVRRKPHRRAGLHQRHHRTEGPCESFWDDYWRFIWTWIYDRSRRRCVHFFTIRI